jgi:hypothetical protein
MGFTADQVEFIALACKPCTDGLVKVESSKVTVVRATMIRYSIKYASTKYQVAFSDATV